MFVQHIAAGSNHFNKRPSLAKLLRLWGRCIRDDLDGFDPDGFGCFIQMTLGQSEFL